MPFTGYTWLESICGLIAAIGLVGAGVLELIAEANRRKGYTGDPTRTDAVGDDPDVPGKAGIRFRGNRKESYLPLGWRCYRLSNLFMLVGVAFTVLLIWLTRDH